MRYVIPGEMTVTEVDGELELTFLPAAAHAGYFGPALLDYESGRSLDLNEAHPLFDRLGEELLEDGQFTARWEG